MLFNSFVFLLAFLPVTYTVFWMLRTASSRYIWLAATGYVFYGYWDKRFCLLMAFSTFVSYTAGLGFLRYTSPLARRLCLVVPITVDLLLLGFFKYANFALASTRAVGHWFGYELTIPTLEIILPVGISFYTFHTITYIVDSYNGVDQADAQPLGICGVRIAVQPAGGRADRAFSPDRGRPGSAGDGGPHALAGAGHLFFTFGMVEKVLVADTLAAFVDPALKDYQTLSTAGVWLAMLGYTFQLYFDFCGYSTMAVGLGYMFGLRIPINFNSPYKAVDPSDFWRRWHISLSSCLRDYLYIPLGGNRQGTGMMYRNLLLTMLIGGLWHGANWTFVIWGAYHGLLLILYRVGGFAWDRLPALVRQFLFFILVVIGWVFFRATSMSMAIALLDAMFTWVPGYLGPKPEIFAVMTLLAGTWAMVGPNAFDVFRDFRWRWWYLYILAAAMGACVAILAGGRTSPFLYFQF